MTATGATAPDTAAPDTAVPDTERHGLLGLLPARARPFGLLARFDRPIGWWLLFWPGAWAVLIAGTGVGHSIGLLALLLVGAIAMRGAGCVYNDVIDRDLDARVARTAARPIASGAVSVRDAWIFLVALCLVGLGVLLCLNGTAQLVSLASLAPVACYPFMKRITWWPQAWLGIVFSWAALSGGAAATGGLGAPVWLLYAGSIAWVVGYDTIYALQDIEDDALAGVKSSARALGSRVRPGVALFYVLALGLWAAALWLRAGDPVAALALLPAALHLAWQVRTLDVDDPLSALARFRANRETGLLVALAAWAVGWGA